ISIILVEGPTPGFVFERAIDLVGHRAHLLPQFALGGGSGPGDNVLGNLGGGLARAAARFMGGGALVGVFRVGVVAVGAGLSRWVLHVTRGEAEFIPSSSIKRSGMHWRMQRWRSRRPARSAGEHARRSICNRLPQRNWRSRQRSMARRRPYGC